MGLPLRTPRTQLSPKIPKLAPYRLVPPSTVVDRDGKFSGCLRCLLLVMCTYPFAKKALTLHLARGEGRERHFGCNLMQRKVLASSHQHLMAEAPVKEECLSKLILFGEKSLRHALREYVVYYHHERNHHGKENLLLFPAIDQLPQSERKVCSRERLGGLLRFYHREVA